MSPKVTRKPNCWWITASERDPEHGWHWDNFLKNPNDPRQPIDWGGPEWIKSSVSFVRIQEMRKGDIIVAYQAGEGIVGFASLASNGYQHIEGGDFDTFDLDPSHTIRFISPIPYPVISQLPEAAEQFEFVKIKQGTVFRVSQMGFDAVVNFALAFNPAQENSIRNFLTR